MHAMPKLLAASVAVVAIMIAMAVKKPSQPDADTNGTVLVVPGKPWNDSNLTSRFVHYRENGSGALPTNSANNAVADDRRTTTSEVVNQLSDSIANEDKDAAWGSAVQRDSDALLSGIPFLNGERSLTCGTIRCEVAIKVPADISPSNMKVVLENLSTLPSDGHQYPFIVEGVFPVDEIGSRDQAIHVIYMRHSN